VYCIGLTNGAIDTYSALGSGDFVGILGIAISTTLLDLQMIHSTVAKA